LRQEIDMELREGFGAVVLSSGGGLAVEIQVCGNG